VSFGGIGRELNSALGGKKRIGRTASLKLYEGELHIGYFTFWREFRFFEELFFGLFVTGEGRKGQSVGVMQHGCCGVTSDELLKLRKGEIVLAVVEEKRDFPGGVNERSIRCRYILRKEVFVEQREAESELNLPCK